jgi:AraC family transcriptional regulator of arabinose operon
MEDYNKIIDSLYIRLSRCRNIVIQKPFRMENLRDIENSLIMVNRGALRLDLADDIVQAGEMIFIPAKSSVTMTYGVLAKATTISYESFLNNEGGFYEVNQEKSLKDIENENITVLNFDAKIFDSVNFFGNLDIGAFKIRDEKLAFLINSVLKEWLTPQDGKERMCKILCDAIGIEIIRYILRKRLFVEQLATNSTYFKDPRLINIFTFIRENIGDDLSNKRLAEVADVSEDYVGQYFKMLTGINPQDYIEYQRMEQAVTLLRSSKMSIKDIGNKIGYKDTAYFCRRFKMMFGIPAGKMRRRELTG